MRVNSRITACRDALIVAIRAAERASDDRSIALLRACLDIVEYLEHQPAATIENTDTAVKVLQRADAEFETLPPRTPAVRAALRKAVDRLHQIREDNRNGGQPLPSVL